MSSALTDWPRAFIYPVGQPCLDTTHFFENGDLWIDTLDGQIRDTAGMPKFAPYTDHCMPFLAVDFMVPWISSLPRNFSKECPECRQCYWNNFPHLEYVRRCEEDEAARSRTDTPLSGGNSGTLMSMVLSLSEVQIMQQNGDGLADFLDGRYQRRRACSISSVH